MAWRSRVKFRKPNERPPIYHPIPGEHVIRVVEEPDEPIVTRYGLRLPFIIKLSDDGEQFTWLIPWREEVGERSLLGQLKKIAERRNGLKGLRLKVTVSGYGVSKRYKVEEIGA